MSVIIQVLVGYTRVNKVQCLNIKLYLVKKDCMTKAIYLI